MAHTRRVLIVFLTASLALAASACGGSRSTTTETPTAAPTSGPAQAPAGTPGPTSQPASTATPATQGLSLIILQPQNETVVDQELLEVQGKTAPDAIVSVNGNMVKTIDMDGNFVAVVSLAEGPNLIEVIATDYQNHQASQTLTVIYAP